MTRRKSAPNAAYKTLRKLGWRTAIARHLLIQLRKNGFVIVEEARLTEAADINRKLEIIIKLMKRRRK